MDADFPEIVPMTLEGPGVVALLPLHHLVLEMLVRGQLALHFDAAAALQSHLGEGYKLGTYHQCGLHAFNAMRIRIRCKEHFC